MRSDDLNIECLAQLSYSINSSYNIAVGDFGRVESGFEVLNNDVTIS